MPAYLQMGHDSENLVGAPGLDGFVGLVLSPVNRDESSLQKHLGKFRENRKLDAILDPQLYFPRSQRGALSTYNYFRSDFETADLTSMSWWDDVIDKLLVTARNLGVEGVCSPTNIPGKWTDDYFKNATEVFERLRAKVENSSIRPLLTVCVNLKELASPSDSLRLASIVSSAAPTEAYLVVDADIEPRRELTDSQNLFALMVLIDALENASCRTLLSHCSSEVLLMKAAGATNCSSGKFFNLRRFSKSRFEEEKDGGGGQLPYWFEHSLLAYLRAADIPRLQREGFGELVSTSVNAGETNTFAVQILEQFANDPKKPWVALGWRQYLSWFATVEKLLSGAEAIQLASTWLRTAEQNWQRLEDADVLFEEPHNNGTWLRAWRQALSDFRKFKAS